MSLEGIYYISQIVASVAVLASLIYLALQTRQAARNQQAQMHMMRLQNVRDDVRKQADPAFIPIFRAGLAAEPSLQPVEGFQFMMYAYNMLLNLQEQYLERKEGMINDRRWEPSKRVLVRYLTLPGFRALYQLVRSGLDAEFVALTDRLISEGKSQPIEHITFERWQELAAAERASTS